MSQDERESRMREAGLLPTAEFESQGDDEWQESPFEAIRHEDDQGDYWLARELMPLLEYHKFQDFDDAIQRAIEDCAKSGRRVDEHFRLFTQTRNKGRPAKEYRLTRYACRLVAMASRTAGDVAAQARSYFSDKVDEAEILSNPDVAYLTWRERAILAFIAEGYSADWSERRVDDIVARNALTHEWGVRGIKQKEYPILTNRLHMGSFGLTIDAHKDFKGFAVTYKGNKLVYKGDLPPAMTMTELALNALANTVARELHVRNDSHGFGAISTDIDVAGRIVGDTRQQIERATGEPVVSPRNMLKEPDGGLWASLTRPRQEIPEDG
jgi:hypothetical protein